MRMRINEQGIQELANEILGMAKETNAARKEASKDVAKMIRKRLIKNRQAGAGMQPLGRISKLLGNRKPWGKKKFTIYVPNPFVSIVTTKGANKNMEEGGFATTTWEFRRFLHAKGIHLKGKKNVKTLVKVPARPLFKITWAQVQGQIGRLYEERFVFQLQRKVRARRYRRGQ